MYKYSIVIPYRDNVVLLNVAVSSIPDREDIQIIIVDNSNTPTPWEKMPCKKFAHVDYLTSSPTKGAGCARNVGLKNVKGEYILFLDADDYFTPDAFEIFDIAAEDALDLTFFKATSVHLKDGTPSNRHHELEKVVNSYLDEHIEDHIRLRFPWPICKMYKSSFIKQSGVQFQEVRCSNDVMFSVKTGYLASNIAVKDSVVYVITEGEINTSLTKTRSADNQFTRFLVKIDRNEFLRSVGKAKYQVRILPGIVEALIHFGTKEFYKYLKVVITKRLNIFVGY